MNKLREISADKITQAVKLLSMKANYNLPEDILENLINKTESEKSLLGKQILKDIVKNANIAREEQMPICQDTGIAVVFVDIGQEVCIKEGSLEKAINDGVRLGYEEGYLRMSVVNDPIIRVNTGDNTPAVIHYKISEGDKIKITVMPKGAGSENTSALKMLKPSDGFDGIKSFVIETVEKAGPNACPPLIVGVGIGGNFEVAPYLSKKALLKSIGERNPNKEIAEFELILLDDINKLGIGPQGLGGTTTALDVHIETYPTHIASLPVAVNLGCHVTRHATIEI